jgi:hypothetical protein
MDPRSWSVFKKQAGRVHVPQLRPGEAEALHRTEWARGRPSTSATNPCCRPSLRIARR